MAKKDLDTEVVEPTEQAQAITTEFGRADLNALRDLVNEHDRLLKNK